MKNKIIKNIIVISIALFAITGCTLKDNALKTDEKLINKNDFIGDLSIHDAIRSRDIEIVNFLIAEKSDLNNKDRYGYTPLHLAVRYNEFEIVKLLFQNGANLNSIDMYGDTPLLDSSRNKSTDISEFLICNGAHRNVFDSNRRSPLNYAAMTKDLYIANMLRSKNLESQCKNNAQININELDIITTSKPEICGKITENISDDIKVTLENEENKSYGPYIAKVNSADKSWCVQVNEELNDSSYLIRATTQLESKKQLVAKERFQIVIEKIPEVIEDIDTKTEVEYELTKESQLEIDIDTKEIENDSTPLICGNFDGDDFKSIYLTLENENKKVFGPYKAMLDFDKKSWCAQVNNNLSNGKYSIDVIGKNENKEEVSTQEDVRIYVLNSLYESLNDEFKDDFKKWDATLDKDTLIFRFNSPNLMFKHGYSKLKNEYKEVLNDFFPRYIKVLEKYEHQIVNIFVEGHTSSEYKYAKDEQEKFDYNMKLSKKRATKVVDYILNIDNEILTENNSWIEPALMPVGKSSSELIKNKDGTENAAMSRRVEFKIKTIPSEM